MLTRQEVILQILLSLNQGNDEESMYRNRVDHAESQYIQLVDKGYIKEFRDGDIIYTNIPKRIF